MKKWTMIKESKDGAAKLWLNNTNGVYTIWCNKASVQGFESENEDEALTMFNNYLLERDAEVLTLKRYLLLNNITLTQTELKSLEDILSEGSFYEEALDYQKDANGELDFDKPFVNRKYGTFIGWEINENEVPGCRGALASLVKKGIRTINYDDGEDQVAYYINFTLEFKDEKQFGYHTLDLD